VPGVRVKDGLFIGNEAASQDEEAITDNKVTRIVNCCGKQVSNVFGHLGVKYLTYNWIDGPTQVILDPSDKVITAVYNFVEEALEQGDGVLIHSFFGNSRSICLVSAYLMKRYRWSMKKALEFLKSRQLEIEMKPNFQQQLSTFELRLAAKSEGPLAMDWEADDSGAVDSEQLLLRNTFLNVSAKTPIDLRPTPPRTHKLKWSDDMADDKSRLEQPPSPEHSPRDVLAQRPALKGSRAALAATGDKLGATTASNGAQTGSVKACTASGNRMVATAAAKIAGVDSLAQGSITIHTRAGVVTCSPEEIVHKRFGLKFACSTIILEYSVPAHNLRAHHKVKVDLPKLATGTLACDAAAAEHLREAHAPWLNGVSAQQLAELIGRLRTASGC